MAPMLTQSATIFFVILKEISTMQSVITTPTTATNGSATTRSAYASVRDDLLSREVTRGRVPPGGGTVPVPVQVTFKPVDILDVNDVKQVVSTTAVLTFNWSDPELAWDFSPDGPYPNIRTVELPVDQIWMPSVYFGNGATNDERELALGKSVFIHARGIVYVKRSLVLDTTCTMDLQKYPFDKQQCQITMMMESSVPIDGQYAQSDYMPEGMNTLLATSAEWYINSLRVEKLKSATHSVSTSALMFYLSIERKTTFFVISFVTPIVMTSYMNALVFLIPVEAGEQISYLVSIFVSNALFLSFFTGEMPQGMDTIPIIMYLVLGVMAESGVLIIINSFFLTRFHRNNLPLALDISGPGTGTGNNRGSLPQKITNVLPSNAVQPEKDGGLEGDVLGKLERSTARPQRNCLTWSVYCFLAAVILNTVFLAILLVAITK